MPHSCPVFSNADPPGRFVFYTSILGGRYICWYTKYSAIPHNSRGRTMRSANLEMIEKLRMVALKRCEERIVRASEKDGNLPKKIEYCDPHYGVSSVLKHKHGLV